MLNDSHINYGGYQSIKLPCRIICVGVCENGGEMYKWIYGPLICAFEPSRTLRYL